MLREHDKHQQLPCRYDLLAVALLGRASSRGMSLEYDPLHDGQLHVLHHVPHHVPHHVLRYHLRSHSQGHARRKVRHRLAGGALSGHDGGVQSK